MKQAYKNKRQSVLTGQACSLRASFMQTGNQGQSIRESTPQMNPQVAFASSPSVTKRIYLLESHLIFLQTLRGSEPLASIFQTALAFLSLIYNKSI